MPNIFIFSRNAMLYLDREKKAQVALFTTITAPMVAVAQVSGTPEQFPNCLIHRL